MIKSIPVTAWLMAQVAADAPHALRLAAQLFGCAPCPECDYIQDHCKCLRPAKEDIDW